MKVVTAQQMKRIDDIAIRERGIPGATLMENAGKAVARVAFERTAELNDGIPPKKAAVVAGKGNNAGDGFIAAAELQRRGVQVTVFLVFDSAELKGDARAAFERLPMKVEIENIDDVDAFLDEIDDCDLIVDAIFGIGLRGPVEGLAAEVIAAIDSRALLHPVYCVDIPSGASGDLEAREGPFIAGGVTIAMGLPKIGLVLGRGAGGAEVIVHNPGFPDDLLTDRKITVNLMMKCEMIGSLPPRPLDGHKGTFGKALILGGSEGMTGAAALAARAASRSGVGLVYVAYPSPLGTIVESLLVEPVKIPLPGGERWFEASQAADALKEASKVDAVALGPGIGRHPSTGKFVAEIVEKIDKPLVIDADGLNLLADDLSLLKRRTAPTILTPHPGEAARLLGTTVEKVQADRLGAFVDFAREHDAIVVLKGARTIVTSPDGQRYINPSGNTGLAKGGSGDVLTGLIVGLLAQGMAPLAAVQVGVHVHAQAAHLAATENGIHVRAMIPSDSIENFSNAFHELDPGIPPRGEIDVMF